jgi:hypothetical protein
MSAITDILRVVDAFCLARKITEPTASTLLFSDGTRLRRVREGADMGARRIERAMGWLSKNWPEGAVWPADISRPQAEVENSLDQPETVASELGGAAQAPSLSSAEAA